MKKLYLVVELHYDDQKAVAPSRWDWFAIGNTWLSASSAFKEVKIISHTTEDGENTKL
jgi:hypothetical protein